MRQTPVTTTDRVLRCPQPEDIWCYCHLTNLQKTNASLSHRNFSVSLAAPWWSVRGFDGARTLTFVMLQQKIPSITIFAFKLVLTWSVCFMNWIRAQLWQNPGMIIVVLLWLWFWGLNHFVVVGLEFEPVGGCDSEGEPLCGCGFGTWTNWWLWFCGLNHLVVVSLWVEPLVGCGSRDWTTVHNNKLYWTMQNNKMSFNYWHSQQNHNKHLS